MMISGT